MPDDINDSAARMIEKHKASLEKLAAPSRDATDEEAREAAEHVIERRRKLLERLSEH